MQKALANNEQKLFVSIFVYYSLMASYGDEYSR